MAQLGVNVDHVATLREARKVDYPDPARAAFLAELGGADQITVHLRQDRRHIQERDVEVLRRTVRVPLNVEIAATEEMLSCVERIRPDVVTLVPERPEELTTEGGLDLSQVDIAPAVARLQACGIKVSVFIDPHVPQVEACAALGVEAVELNTGRYCELPAGAARDEEVQRIRAAAEKAGELQLYLAAGHGLDIYNLPPLCAAVPLIAEYNIGHSIVCRSVYMGLEAAVAEIKSLIS